MTNATEYDPALNDGPPEWDRDGAAPPDPRTVTAGPGPDYVTGIDPSIGEVTRVLAIRHGGSITFDDIVVGRCDRDPDGAPRVVLNLGWLKAAGLGLTVQNDPDVDTGRKGHVLQRPEPQPAPEPF